MRKFKTIMINIVLFLALYLVLLLVSCKTTEQLIKNSAGYDHTKQTEENKLLMDKKPEWLINWSDWKKEMEKDGVFLFIMGRSAPSLAVLEKEGKHYWSPTDATDEVWRHAMRQVSYHISTKINDEFQERIEAAMSVKGTQEGESVEELKLYQANEQMILESSVSSSSAFGGLHETGDIFSETWEYKGKNVIIATHSWQIFRISRADIDTARKMISDDRERHINERSLEARLIANDEREFERLTREYNETITELSDIDISVCTNIVIT